MGFNKVKRLLVPLCAFLDSIHVGLRSFQGDFVEVLVRHGFNEGWIQRPLEIEPN